MDQIALRYGLVTTRYCREEHSLDLVFKVLVGLAFGWHVRAGQLFVRIVVHLDADCVCLVRRLEFVAGENAAIWDETRCDWCARVKSSDARLVRVNDTGFLLIYP